MIARARLEGTYRMAQTLRASDAPIASGAFAPIEVVRRPSFTRAQFAGRWRVTGMLDNVPLLWTLQLDESGEFRSLSGIAADDDNEEGEEGDGAVAAAAVAPQQLRGRWGFSTEHNTPEGEVRGRVARGRRSKHTHTHTNDTRE